MITTMACLLLTLSAPALAEEPVDEAFLKHLLDKTDDTTRGDQSFTVMTMHVKTKRYERTMTMKAWSKGTDHTLIRIEAPAKDAGIATLKVGENLWNYLPKVDRTMRVPSGMMSGSWMGSHFTNDDLVKESRLSEDFTYTLAARPNEEGVGSWVIECVATEDAAVVWGKIVVTLRADEVPLSMDYYDEDGEKIRTMTYSDVREVDGQLIPHVMTLTPLDKEGEYTRITFETLDLSVQLEDSFFSLQNLQK